MPSKDYRKPDAMRKVLLIKLYVTDSEKALIKAEAASRTMTATATVRAILARHYGRPTPILKARKENAPLLRELTRIGNNLNQLVKQAHEEIVPVKAARVQSVLDELRALITRL